MGGSLLRTDPLCAIPELYRRLKLRLSCLSVTPVGHGVKSGYVDIQNDTPGKRVSRNLDSLSAMTREPPSSAHPEHAKKLP